MRRIAFFNFAFSVLIWLLPALLGKQALVYGQASPTASPKKEPVEQRLLRLLLKDYDSKVRPVLDSSQIVNISLGLGLTIISEIDERHQSLSTNVDMNQEWHDPRLTWEPAKFDNFSQLRIPWDRIWLPDIVLYNSADDQSRTYHKSLAIVSSNGVVYWPPILRFVSSCKLDLTFYPFDDQICRLTLGSWAYDGFQLDLSAAKRNIVLSSLVKNGEWDVKDTRVVKNIVYYPCCEEPWPQLDFHIHLRRRNLHYTFNIIIPCLLLSMLTLCSFALPPDSGEKITLGLTLVLAYSVFLLLIAEKMPPTAEFTPLIGVYLTVVMGLTSLSVVCAVLVLNLHHRGVTNRRPHPLLYRFVTDYLGRAVCLSRSSAEQFSHSASVFPSSRRSTIRRTSIRVEDTEGNPNSSEAPSLSGEAGEQQSSVGGEISGVEMTLRETEPVAMDNNGNNNNDAAATARLLANPRNRSPLLANQQRRSSAAARTAMYICRVTALQQQPPHSAFDVVSSGKQMTSSKTETQNTMLGHLSWMTNKQERIEEEAACIREWQLIAYVVDRVLLICFVCIVVMTTAWLLLIKPMLKNVSIDAKDSVKRFE